jgi:hydrogenase maturation protein HypF
VPDRIPPYSRIRVEITGIVQGVGFRPFVFRLAGRHSISGWVRNTPAGVVLEGEGTADSLAAFLGELEESPPPLAVISGISSAPLPPTGEERFRILPSEAGENLIQIAPDGDVCGDCLEELFSPSDRRFRYAFINCTNCGPRYSIITDIPYDRPLTTMARFAMCDACRAEYDDPADRRFHAQPIACPDCGPQLGLVDGTGRPLAPAGESALDTAVALLREGRILAIKGLGGYHLAADPCNDETVAELRRRKKRDEKPFALMAPTIEAVRRLAACDSLEERLLAGVERPIVLLRKRVDAAVSPLVAPANGYLGLMLPATPLHHLLLRDSFDALIMTSGNTIDEPILYRADEALRNLAGIADGFLTHDREIHSRSDDSVIRVFQGNPLFLRRSRGYVPRAVTLPAPQRAILAVGGELKCAVCLTKGDRAFLSQHLGDLKNSATHRFLAETTAHLTGILEIIPEAVAHDLHPDYLSTVFAEEQGSVRKIAVQHHHGHMASCMAENRLEGEVIGVIFDGAGYGPDGKVWGGEFLLGSYGGFRRRGHFREVQMPGGDAASREPFRMALAYLFDRYREKVFDLPLPCLERIPAGERSLFRSMLSKGINSPLTSSCGRLFDAVAALLGLRSVNSYEGQGAIELEGVADRGASSWNYPYAIGSTGADSCFIVDFRLTIDAILADLAAEEAKPVMARRFHDTVAAAAADACERIGRESGVTRVVLSGGVFQNKLLTERLHRLLTEREFQVYTHRLVPPNDGGLALGQAVIAGWELEHEACLCRGRRVTQRNHL